MQQFVEEGHLRWDSLGEFLALAVSLADLGSKHQIDTAVQLGDTLNQAIGKHLDENKSPQRKVGQLDNRGSHYYLTRYWAEAMATAGVAGFAALAEGLAAQEATILAEIDATQGQPQDIGGYYHPDPAKAEAAMRPSATLNALLAELSTAG